MNRSSSPPSQSVSELNQAVKRSLECQFRSVRIHGEISNLARPRSGHLYFTLKDAQAQVQCAWFSPRNAFAQTMENGETIVVTAGVSLYPQRGDYQLIVRDAIPLGEGAWQQKFEALKRDLMQVGLFEKKSPIPTYPEHLALVTSATGAALEDMLRVLSRRYPRVRLTLVPTMVQGPASAEHITKALKQADQLAADAILLARGGGSIEDLWGFNSEVVARQMFACHTPIVTGIGHEIDTTIADYVADLRAATPSAAAECATPDQTAIIQDLDQQQARMDQAVQQCLAHHRSQWQHTQARLRHPREALTQQRALCTQWRLRLTQAMKQQCTHHGHRLAKHSDRLIALNPLHVLKRGYAIPMHNDQPLTSATQCPDQTPITLTFHDGQRHAIMHALKAVPAIET